MVNGHGAAATSIGAEIDEPIQWPQLHPRRPAARAFGSPTSHRARLARPAPTGTHWSPPMKRSAIGYAAIVAFAFCCAPAMAGGPKHEHPVKLPGPEASAESSSAANQPSHREPQRNCPSTKDGKRSPRRHQTTRTHGLKSPPNAYTS
jgi:hypothetical protein